MVAGKVKMAAMGGLQRSSQSNSKPNSSPKPLPSSIPQGPVISGSGPGKHQLPKGSATFTRSFGANSVRQPPPQVQPRPPDVGELLRLVEELRQRESRLKNQLVEQNILKKSGSAIPLLENRIADKESEIERFKRKIECLEAENERLREEVEMLHLQLSRQNGVHNENRRNLEAHISDLTKLNEVIVSTPRRIVDERVENVNLVMVVDNVVGLNPVAPRLPKPPPRTPSFSSSSPPQKAGPPPPPPPPGKGFKGSSQKVRRVPEVVEFYHSLMRRDTRRESSGGGGGSGVVDAQPAMSKDMIGEIRNRSAHLLAIKTDVETHGDLIRFLIKQVENAAFTHIDEVVLFVKWLDDQLSVLVDERAVLKHFNWPEQKSDALRESAFGYCDFKKLESEASSFRDDPRQHCGPALKKMQTLLERLEHGVYNLSRMGESASKRYKGFNIPTDWMQDTGCVNQIKLASVKLAMKYMKRVAVELEAGGCGPEEEELIVQGVRFAFRVHQFAGGFDVETMKAFQELRDKARSCHRQCQNQQHQNIICSSTAY